MTVIKIETTRFEEYEVELDESKITPHMVQEWSKFFKQCNSMECFAKHLANAISKYGIHKGFIEGFGFVKIIDSDGIVVPHFDGTKQIPDSTYTVGITVRVIEEGYADSQIKEEE